MTFKRLTRTSAIVVGVGVGTPAAGAGIAAGVAVRNTGRLLPRTWRPR
jgi:hypothetical protein